MSLGEDRVRITFNPAESGLVHMLKHGTAALIDICNEVDDEDNSETRRLFALAMKAYEEACMWAVKAATPR